MPDGDVVVATWWMTAEWASGLGPSKGRKVYFVQGHEVGPHLDRSRVEATYRLPFPKIVVSSWLQETMADLDGDLNVMVVHNGVDMAQFSAPPRKKNVRPTIGLLYSATSAKRLADGLAVIEKVQQSIPDLRVLIFGATGPTRDLPVPPYAEFHLRPAQDRIKDIYAQCDVWLCTSSPEGFYLPFLEAMACRCPVVSTRIGGPADIIAEGRNGFLLGVGDVDGLAARAQEVLQMPPERWRAMSDAAYETAARCTWDEATAAFERVLQDLAGRDP